ncbi:MAG: suppressor of fused domain protein, partial [Acidimicrobiales bacterium]
MSRGGRAIAAHVDAADGGPATSRHHPPAPPRFGGGRPLDSVSIHHLAVPGRSPAASMGVAEHWHLVTAGLTELEYKETADPAVSGWGFELTLRVVEAEAPLWAVDLLGALAAYVWTTGHPFAAGHHVDLGGPVKLGARSALSAAAVVVDPRLGPLAGPFGSVEFLQLVGLTADELEACRAWSTEGVLGLVRQVDPLLLTRLDRPSVFADPVNVEAMARGQALEGSALTELRIGSLDLGRRPGGRVRLTVGAGASAALGAALRRELVAEGATFRLVGDQATVEFSVAGRPAWAFHGGGLRLETTLAGVASVAGLFTGRTGTGRL